MKAELLRLVNRLKRKPGLLAFRHSIDRLRSIYPKREADPQRLVKQILVDKALVVQVLRTANSVFYNPAGIPLTTVSRAVVVLGMDTIKQAALTAPVLSMAQEQDPFFLKEISLSYLIAYIAREAAEGKRLNPEEVYLAGLFRRVGREILFLNALDLYRRLLVKPEETQKSLSGLVAERLLSYWNLPPLLLEGLEGQRLGVNPTILTKILFLSERLAEDFLNKRPLRGWNQLFESPDPVYAVLEKLRKDLETFPPTVAANLKEILASRASFTEEAAETEEIILPLGALSLLKKILGVLEEELETTGVIAFKSHGRWQLEGGGELSEALKRLSLEEVLRGKDLSEFLIQRYRVLAIPFEVAHTPAGVILLFRRGTFSKEEYAGLKLLKKTIDRLLRHF